MTIQLKLNIYPTHVRVITRLNLKVNMKLTFEFQQFLINT